MVNLHKDAKLWFNVTNFDCTHCAGQCPSYVFAFFCEFLGRTILISTHHMDEAEMISDRIVMLHQGKLICKGSPLYLKSQYGSGYHLTVAKYTGADEASSSQG